MLTQTQIKTLQDSYSKIERMDPALPTYSEVAASLDRMPDKLLLQVAESRIKWLSTLANSRVIRRRMNNTWSLLGPHHDAIVAEAQRLVNL